MCKYTCTLLYVLLPIQYSDSHLEAANFMLVLLFLFSFYLASLKLLRNSQSKFSHSQTKIRKSPWATHATYTAQCSGHLTTCMVHISKPIKTTTSNLSQYIFHFPVVSWQTAQHICFNSYRAFFFPKAQLS